MRTDMDMLKPYLMKKDVQEHFCSQLRMGRK